MDSDCFRELRRSGDHIVVGYDLVKFDFRGYFETLYGSRDLEHLESASHSGMGLQDVETDLHKKFYTDIKTNTAFKELYCNFIRHIYMQYYPDEQFLIYQSFPSVRFQFKNNTAVPPHYDSDHIGRHPVGERNFLVPITSMYGTNRLFIESEPGRKDFEGVTLNTGELFMFNGNRCTHYNQVNTEPTIRISLDFRTISQRDYMNYLLGNEITTTNPRDPDQIRKPVKMIIGGYYQMSRKNQSLEEMMDWHVQKDMLQQTRPNFDICEANACFDYMKDGINYVTEYQQTTKLEEMLAKFIGVKHVLMTTSGSMSLALALMGCGIGSGDDVIVPDYTMIATINAVKMVGANPVIADVDGRTYTLTRDIVERYRTPATKCVLFVSLNNRQVDLGDIAHYCQTTGLCLVEDAAQSLGARINGKHFGTFGRAGCFSLSTPKIISTGQGGFVVTNDDTLASKMMMIKNFGRKTGGVDNFELFGLNLKFTDIQAVIGIEQMKKLPERVVFMRNLYQSYFTEIEKIPGVRMIPRADENYVPWFVDIYTEKRDELADFLKKHNIQTRPTYPSIHTTPMYTSSDKFPNATYVSQNGLFLPTHTLLTQVEVRHICKLITCFFGDNAI